MKVKFTSEELHEQWPEFYPPAGTVGVVLEVDQTEFLVQWPKGSTADDGQFYANRNSLEVVND